MSREDRKDILPTEYGSSGLKISDFCDMDLFEKMMSDWAKCTGLATAAIDNDGNYISGNYNFTEFCRDFNRKSPEGSRRCCESDKKDTGFYLCHAGLIDFAEHITLDDGTVLGSIVGGQVLPENPDEECFRRTAREIGVDEDKYIEALHKVNIRSREQVEASAALLFNVINLFVRKSYAANKDALILSERHDIILSLGKIYFCDYFVDLTEDRYMELNAPPGLHALFGNSGTAIRFLPEFIRNFVRPEYVADFTEFANLSTVGKRMGKRDDISLEFVSRDSGWCRAYFIAVNRNRSDAVKNVIFALQHIQEEKKKNISVEQALKDAADRANRANQAKSEFLSRMSHDIRTPMNGIIGMTRIAQEQDNPEKTADCLKKIDVSSTYLLGLINDILDMSRIESGEIKLHPEPYPAEKFGQYLESVVRPLAEARKQKFLIRADISPDRVPVIDKLHANQVVFNLLSNAIKYTQEGGTVKFRVTETVKEDRMLMNFSVTDNGRGMSREFQKILFEPFSQEDRVRSMAGKSGGTGLGLAIVKKIVTLMGGTITVKSKLNVGSIFSVDLPLNFISAEDYHEAARKKLHIGNTEMFAGKDVLLCEDNRINQEIAQTMLEKYGMIVELAENGRAGKRAFESSPIGHFQAILMDIRMPLMDGYEATRAIRELPREDAGTVPIIAMTADAFEEDISNCLKAGMNDHIAKPLDPARVTEILLSLIK